MLVTTAEEAKGLQHLLAKSSRDADLRQRLLDDPRKTLKAAGMNVRSEIEVRPVESTADVIYLVLPAAPEEGAVPDSELDGAAGGATPTIVPIVILAAAATAAIYGAIDLAIERAGGEGT